MLSRPYEWAFRPRAGRGPGRPAGQLPRSRGLIRLVRGARRARQEFAEWASAEAAPGYRLSSLSPGLREALRELDELQERMRRENPELDAAWSGVDVRCFPDDYPLVVSADEG